MKHERKSTWRSNLFDLVIVALGAAVMAVIVLVMRPAAANISETVPMEYTVELQNMPEGAWELVNTGDMLYDNIRNQAMGTVVAVDHAPTPAPSPTPAPPTSIRARCPMRRTSSSPCAPT